MENLHVCEIQSLLTLSAHALEDCSSHFVCLFVCLSVCLFVCLCVSPSVADSKMAEIFSA